MKKNIYKVHQTNNQIMIKGFHKMFALNAIYHSINLHVASFSVTPTFTAYIMMKYSR
ncbi:uncharacterized protein isoform X2 [Musca autumnalis]|uniref:uncharacterized protein isoform X2 n=1 Tax=Musca autumnalis TaxID=221902 RepID=UPI003CF6EDB6